MPASEACRFAGSSFPTSPARLLAIILLAWATTGCGGADAARAATDGPGGSRLLYPLNWDTVWVAGGSERDSLLLMPSAMAATAERVYVADLAASRLVALDARDGSLAWTGGRKGAGPGEFRDPRALAATPDGGAVVADIGNARLSFFDRDGALAREVAFPGVGYVASVCPLADGSLLMSTLQRQNPLLHMEADGTVLARHPLPWPDLRDAHPMAVTAQLAPTPDHGGCVLALTRGRGFAVFRDGEFRTHPYVESFDLPEVEMVREGNTMTSTISSHRIAARDVDVAGDTVFVTFAGESPVAGHVVDVYTLADGAYRFSHRHDRPIQQSARSGGAFLLMHESEGYPALVAAYAPTAKPPRP